MRICDKDFYYGVVLNQLAIHPTFTSINKVGLNDGLYQINDMTRILIKYSTSDENWRFKFTANDFDDIEQERFFHLFIVLVCPKTICLLSYSDLQEIVNIKSKKSQWISFNYSGSKKMVVTGPLRDLSHKVAHNAFPGNIFDENGDPRWPPYSELKFYDDTPNIICSTKDRYFDLADNLDYLANNINHTYTIFFGLKTISHAWKTWNEDNLDKIEKAIKYDFEFDGLKVDIERITKTTKNNEHCHDQFVWKLLIVPDYGD